MQRRVFLAAMVSAPTLAALLAACGDDSVVSPGAAPDGTSPGTSTTMAVSSRIPYPTGADDVVLRYGYEGGFVAAGTIFISVPTLMVTGDGRVIEPGATTAIYPGALLPSMFERSIDQAGIEALLSAAQKAGMLASPPDYQLPDGIGIADAPDTVLAINANNAQYLHRAYALGMADQPGATTPARKALSDFLASLGNLETLVGKEHLGDPRPLVAQQYRFQAMVVDPATFADPAPTVVPWPAGTGVELKAVTAELGTCATVDAAAVGDLFSSANQLTFFEEAGVAYQLSAVAVLPGDAACTL
jgi:hypothetical protein